MGASARLIVVEGAQPAGLSADTLVSLGLCEKVIYRYERPTDIH